MTVFENIKKYAKLSGMNLQTVAEKAGLSRNIIYQYDKGVNPSMDTLRKIAKVLNVDAEDLLENKSGKKHPVDLADDEQVFMYQGRPIPEEEWKIIKRILGD